MEDLDPDTAAAAGAVAQALDRLHADLRLLIIAAGRLAEHIAELQAQTPRLVKIHGFCTAGRPLSTPSDIRAGI